ncbi:MAG: hypothetical protein JRI58_13985 [Deltaproteobacteria bacterium]|nr:hypothetical protein [Deltaproteobacteria bacterium]
MTNTHLQIIKDLGFGPFLQEFGYEEIWELDESRYTPFQRRLKDYLDHGKVFPKEDIDENIFTFAYNKTNLKASGVAFQFFKSYPKRKDVEILRSTFRDETMVEEFLDMMEEKVGVVNSFLYNILEFTDIESHRAIDFLNGLRSSYWKRFEAELGREDMDRFDGAFKIADAIMREANLPV